MADKPPPYSDAVGSVGSTSHHSQNVYQQTTYGPALRLPDVNYIKSVCGITKIVQAVVSLIAFIMSLVVGFNGNSFVSFSTINSFIQAVIWFILHLTHAIPQILANYYIELIMYIILDLFLFISAIVAAAYGWIHPAVGAISFFTFAATVACGIDTMFQIIDIRQKFASREGTLAVPTEQS